MVYVHFLYVCVCMCVAGTCITSDDYVIRDIHYNGNEVEERATVITRIAPSFIRYTSKCNLLIENVFDGVSDCSCIRFIFYTVLRCRRTIVCYSLH